MKINLDSVNGHIVQAWILLASGVSLMALTGLSMEGGALFGFGLARLERALEKPNDENGEE